MPETGPRGLLTEPQSGLKKSLRWFVLIAVPVTLFVLGVALAALITTW